MTNTDSHCPHLSIDSLIAFCTFTYILKTDYQKNQSDSHLQTDPVDGLLGTELHKATLHKLTGPLLVYMKVKHEASRTMATMATMAMVLGPVEAYPA
jgi:hypothetical protein